ncbi:hypothetical protein [Mesorhizobium sp. LNJC386A00]|uniref:hypothetical protein n=1 Tax=Mesorhizobium sp. LNJC386A00 TaxID=1287270 RepID=UPI0018DC45C4|nr:hypothetical protein [Mesorhizobium sp. LNJC386A00]
MSKCSRPWTAYATRAAEKLRRDKLAAVQGFVFLHANAFNDDRCSHAGKAVDLDPTDDTQELEHNLT